MTWMAVALTEAATSEVLDEAQAFEGLTRHVGHEREPAVQVNPLEEPHGYDSFDPAQK